MVDDTTSGGGDKKRLCAVAAAVARWHAEDPLDSLPVEEFSIRAHAAREHKVGCL